ncbi:MAG: DNA mismatch repair protein MutS [Bacteroidia bacterium]|nr:DNA mismatch repair protein MutS [Bacteroidia bacterium]
MAKIATKESKETPLMKQYNTIKAKYPDALLLFRVGDFYETFGQDAVKTSQILGIILTKRSNGAASDMELAGFPHHSLDSYLPKLVNAGYRVAICDQLEDPKLTKTIVKRGVTEVVTPGVTLNDKVLDHKSNNYLAAVHQETNNAGVAFLDVSTGEFICAQGTIEYIEKLLQNFKPSEVIVQRNKKQWFAQTFGENFYCNTLEDWTFTGEFAFEILTKQFNTRSLKGFGIEDYPQAIVAAGAALQYLKETEHNHIGHIASIARVEEDKYVWLDRFTIRNLELAGSVHENAVTLIDVIDKTVTPQGSRLLKRWLALPLKQLEPILERQLLVEYFFQNQEILQELQELCHLVGDLERLASKVAVGRANPRDINQIKKSLQALLPIKEICASSKLSQLQLLGDQLNPCQTICNKIANELMPDAPWQINKGGVMALGVNPELDELRNIAYNGKDYLLQMQQREIEKTNIPSLKIAFNNVFGYYLEVTNTHKDKVPADWIRKQTLTNAERYITEELKQYEEKILGAEGRILSIEQKLFTDLLLSLTEFIAPIQVNASIIAKLDCLLSFAKVAHENKYVKPDVNESQIISIKEGRHPVIEKRLPPGEPYITNDLFLDTTEQQIMVITGPNMSGKSALLRQTALIVLLAQIGSFVPAGEAQIGMVDKIFTRVGASDNLSSGESTFMVEMNETASILNNLSNRSLILLDEIGRGTSTYDGISIAWAIAEYLHEHPTTKAKTLFATHYHELNDMAKRFNRIKNYNVSVKEVGNKVVFTRKLIPGGSEHSFGIHVARMAGMPSKVVDRASLLLKELEAMHEKSQTVINEADILRAKTPRADQYQLSFFQLDDPLLQQIKEEIINTDINSLTPVEALFKLNEIKKLLGK